MIREPGMQAYPAMRLLMLHGRILAAAAFGLILFLFGLSAAGVTANIVMAIAALAAAIAIGGAILLLREIVTIIADTLVPLP